MTSKQRLLNHVAFVIDRSGSMGSLNNQVDQVVQGQITKLDELDQATGQETHVSIFVFGSTTRCVIYDTDVKRLVGKNVLAGHYDGGMTSLLDATLTVQEDLAKIPQLYCDHAFLTYILTDGGENESHSTARGRAYGIYDARQTQARLVDELKVRLRSQGDNFTVAVLVPNVLCQSEAVKFGFDKSNTLIWDVSKEGLAAAERRIGETVSDFYQARSQGVRGTKELFAPSKADVQAAGLKPLPTDSYLLLNVIPTKGIEITIPKRTVLVSRPEGLKHVEIKDFIEANGHPYRTGDAYYELTKSEKIDGTKGVIVVENATGLAYEGAEARKLVGLDMYSTRARPLKKDKAGKREFDIFVQSTSTNRLLEIHNSRVLLKTRR